MSKPLDSGKTFFNISVNTGQICMGFEADTTEKRKQHVYLMGLSDNDLVKKFLTSNQILPGMGLHWKEMKQENCR